MTAIVDTSVRSPSAPLSDIRAWSERIQGAIMIAVLVFGAWQGAAALATPAAQRRLAPAMDGSSVLAGRTAVTINYIEAHYLPADGVLRAAGGVARWGLFRSGGPQVAVGCDDWLYLADELRPWPDATAHMQARADTLGRVAETLAKRGIALVVALVPDKARIEAETLCGRLRSAQADARYGAFTALLKAHDIPAVDLATAFTAARRDGPLFYRTDTHWNQRGAALAARRIAEVAAGISPIEDQRFRYRSEIAATQTERPGDLLRLMSLDGVPDVTPKLRPRPDVQFVEQTTQVEAPAETGGLLDEGEGGQVVLLGSSFSLNSNFQGRLQEALRLPVGNFAEAGGGFASAARTYFKGGAFADTPPKLVIWEIPERVVGQPLDAADRALAEGW